MIKNLHIAEIGGTPLKSSHYYRDIDFMIIDSLGSISDRGYMFVEAETHLNERYHKGEVAQPGQFLSQREDPVLARIHAMPDFIGLLLNSEGHEQIRVRDVYDEERSFRPVSVWKWSGIGVDQGDEAAEWGRGVIGRPVRLVKTSLSHPRYVEGKESWAWSDSQMDIRY